MAYMCLLKKTYSDPYLTDFYKELLTSYNYCIVNVLELYDNVTVL